MRRKEKQINIRQCSSNIKENPAYTYRLAGVKVLAARDAPSLL